MPEAEEWIRKGRQRLRLAGFPTAADTWRLAALLQAEGVLEVEIRVVARAFQFSAGKVRRIILPEAEDEDARTAALLEEIGHALLAPGTGSALPPLPTDERRRLRLFLARDRRAEADCGAFVRAWRLPADLMLDYLERPEELRADSGCSAAEIAARWEEIVR